MPLIAVVGPLGSGKTCAQTWLGMNAANKGRTLYSNYSLYGITYRPLRSADDLNDARDGVVLLDEAWLSADSRTSQSKRNRLITKLLIQTRKHHLDVIYTAQAARQIDVRAWINTDLFLLPRRMSMSWLKLQPLAASGYRRGPATHFNPLLTYPFYDTDEVIEPLEDDALEPAAPIRRRFSENKAWIDFMCRMRYRPRAIFEANRELEKEIKEKESSSEQLLT